MSCLSYWAQKSETKARHRFTKEKFHLAKEIRRNWLSRAINQYIKEKREKDHEDDGDEQFFEENYFIVSSYFPDSGFHFKI